LSPVRASPIYNQNENALWNLMNSGKFVKGPNHRFKNDLQWGELLDRMRLGLMTNEDYDFLDTCVLGPNLSLPDEKELNGASISYACPTNAQRNRITEQNCVDMLKTIILGRVMKWPLWIIL
jgi:hypothetical protein